ncbi:MAG: ATP-binding protein [Dehalococcoidia bacterium]|nr:ATP-binding protein [Dehalococcoidia bacterium]
MTTPKGNGERVLLADSDAVMREVFRSYFERASYCVIEASTGQEALSKALEDKPDLMILESELPDMDGMEVCRLLQEGPTTKHIPVMFLAAKAQHEYMLEALETCALEYMTKPIAPEEVVSRVHAYFRRSRQDKDSNPLSGLPGANLIRAELESRIAQKRHFAFLYVDADSFKAFNDYYGFSKGNQAIQLLASVLEEAVQFLGNSDDLIGHIGGDDFTVITSPARAKPISSRIIADFDRRITSLYDGGDVARGFIETEDRLGLPVRHPLMTISIGGVTNERRVIDSYLRASEVAAEVRRRAKAIQGSSCYFDRRDDGLAPGGPAPSPAFEGLSDEHFRSGGNPAELVSLIAHELRTPVTAMRNCLETLMNTLPEGAESEQGQLLSMAYRRVKRLAGTVSDLATYDLLERDGLDADLELVDLSELVGGVLEEVREVAEEKGITTRIEGAAGLDPSIVDRVRLAEALGHLVDNAVKFTSPQGTVVVTISSEDSTVKIEVADTGPGIPEGQMASIFRTFRQIESPMTRRAPGLGLGLHLAKRSVEAMGGRLGVSSEVGKGTTFTVVLPKSWCSNSVRVRDLQEASANAVSGVLSQLKSLGRSPRRSEVPSAKFGETVASLRSGIQEVEVLANRAMLLAERTGRLLEKEEKMVQWLQADMVMVIESLVSLIENHRPFAPGISRRVASYALRIASEVNLPRKDQNPLYCAALLHDLGMVVLPPDALKREGPLTEDEWAVIQRHPKLGAGAISHVKALSPALPLIMTHQERYDGRGYPQRLRGWDIPKGARILAVAIAYDAMVSHRPHRPAMSPVEAKESVAAEAGKSFDPQVVKAFLSLWEAGEFHRF